MRLNLKVPFAEKDQAKKLGARWDAARKIWFIDGKADLSAFAKWSPTAVDSDEGAPSVRPVAARSAPGKVVTGSDYVASPRVCECLPWDVCDQCASMAISC
ncbi:DUF5710 domain-containing protein [Dechloromonas denitrificans]|uniref:DUF5710 domain-containing protein n=1 Tax=Dechloromonas denitrificans TaxID=281362 RepID=UPI001CF8F196|nr:DUF5710 domain-containing protein [Dechloromonas denitrificans]